MQTTTATIRSTTIDELRTLAGGLFEAHYQEIARHKRIQVLQPDWPRYELMERTGVLFALAAWVDQEMIGYSVTFVMPHLHYASMVYAQNDVLFVAEAHRRSRVGIELIYATEQAATARGAKLMTWHAKPGTTLETVLDRMHYGVQDLIFSKEL